jgi:photosystem II stability/assembly factor-like uncharacterized protein
MKNSFIAILILLSCCNILSQNIEVVSPNGGEFWEMNTLKEIKWTSSGITNVKIEYTVNSDTTWNTIISSISAGIGNYYWMVPNITSKLCRIKISDTDNASIFDVSDDLFSIKNFYEIEPNNNASEPNPIELKDSIAGSISPLGDIDYYKFFGNTGDTLEITLKNRNNSELSCYVSLFHESGDRMSSDWFNSDEALRIPFKVPYAGNFFIRIAYRYENFPNKPAGNLSNNLSKDQEQKLNKPDKVSAETGDYSLILKRFTTSAPQLENFSYYDTYYNSIRAEIWFYPNGLDTRVTLEYGLTDSYGSTIELPDTINDIYLSSLSSKIKNLESNTTYHIRAVAENSSGVAVSPDYTFSTSEAPENWTIITNDSCTNRLNDVSFANENIGYAIENYYGLKTTDGGDTWTREYFGDYMRKVFCINVNTTVIITSYRDIYKTTDGGSDWSTINTNIEENFNDVYFYDVNNGIIVGNEGVIIKTTNGGDNWTVSSSGTTENLYSICFGDNSSGWAAGDNGTILKTTDGGTTWNPQNSGTTDYLSDVCFINSDTGFAVCRYDVLLKTTNGGTTWISQTMDDISYTNISFVDNNNGLLVNRYSILHTNDGGQSWIPQKIGTANRLYGVSKAGNSWIIVGDYGTMIRSAFGEVGVKDKNEIPVTFKINQNYPNPFNPDTKISFSIPQASFITLKVYDILGKEVAILVNKEKPAGVYEVEFNGADLPSGIYFYQFKSGTYTETKKMVLMK